MIKVQLVKAMPLHLNKNTVNITRIYDVDIIPSKEFINVTINFETDNVFKYHRISLNLQNGIFKWITGASIIGIVPKSLNLQLGGHAVTSYILKLFAPKEIDRTTESEIQKRINSILDKDQIMNYMPSYTELTDFSLSGDAHKKTYVLDLKMKIAADKGKLRDALGALISSLNSYTSVRTASDDEAA